MIFNFVISYLGFLKFVPGLPQLFDTWLKLSTYLTRPAILDHVDDIGAISRNWDGVKLTNHKYGGLQFNYRDKEIGHIHGNGLLDMPFSRKEKALLMQDGRVQDHHHFKNSGWISFYIRTAEDKDLAIQLLQRRYQYLKQRRG